MMMSREFFINGRRGNIERKKTFTKGKDIGEKIYLHFADILFIIFNQLLVTTLRKGVVLIKI